MRTVYKISDTKFDLLDILEFLAKGYSAERIVSEHPELTLTDIQKAARLAHTLVGRYMIIESYNKLIDRSEKARQNELAPIRYSIKNNPLQWSEDELIELQKLIKNNARLKEMARIFKRSKLALKMQIEKMGLITKE